MGRTVDQSYAAMLGGYSNVYMTVDPCNTLLVLAGRSGRGKSSLLQSCPYAYIINGDCSSTPKRLRAVMWPGVRRDGTPVEANPDAEDPSDPEQGTPFVLDWNACLRRKDMLIELSQSNQPRPRLVALDTVDLIVPLVQQWLVDQHNAASPENVKERFDELDGRQAYPKLYEQIRNFGLQLKRAGYGFAWVFHLGDKTVYLSDKERKYLVDVPLVNSNLWDAVVAHAEVVAALDHRVENHVSDVEIKDASGKVKIDPRTKKPLTRTKTTKTTSVVMSMVPSGFNSDAKKRYASLPDELILSKDDPWSTYENAVRLAMETEAAL